MKKQMLALCLIMVLLLTGCAGKVKLEGAYSAVNPPQASGEMVIEELKFDKKQVTMISGSTEQTVDYEIKDGKFTIITKFGSFAWDFEQKADGTLVIDGVDYQKQ